MSGRDECEHGSLRRACETCALKEELAEVRAKAEKDSSYAQNAVDKICHYRNLAIILGAKPEQMLGPFDRKLCVDGIDKDDNNGGYHMSVQDVLDDNAETWGAHDKMERERDEARAEVARLTKLTEHMATELNAAWDSSRRHEAERDEARAELTKAVMRVAEAVREACADGLMHTIVFDAIDVVRPGWHEQKAMAAHIVRGIDLATVVKPVKP